jgi:hypothetical protein
MDFTRNVDKVERIGRLPEERSKTIEGNVETTGRKEGSISKSQVLKGGEKVQENVYIFRFNKEAARERQN